MEGTKHGTFPYAFIKELAESIVDLVNLCLSFDGP